MHGLQQGSAEAPSTTGSWKLFFVFFFSISLLNQSRNLQTRILLPQDTTGKIFTQQKETLYLFSFPSMLWLHRTGNNSISPHPQYFCLCARLGPISKDQ